MRIFSVLVLLFLQLALLNGQVQPVRTTTVLTDTSAVNRTRNPKKDGPGKGLPDKASPEILAQQKKEEAIQASVTDTTAPIVRTWQLKDDYSRLADYTLDTAQTSFQIFNPVMRNNICNLYLGNLGLAARTNHYFEIPADVRYFFLVPYKPYLASASDNVYFNVRKPFTVLEYSSTGQNKERRGQMVRVFHSQNFNPFLNGGFDIRLSSSEGNFSNQTAKLTNARFFSSYIKGDFSGHGSFAYNSFRINENGGIQDDSAFIESNFDERTYAVNMSDDNSHSLLRNLNFQVTSRYRFGRDSVLQDTTTTTGFRRLRDRTSKTGSFIHTIEYEHNKRLYEDYTGAIVPGFYDHFFIDPSRSKDSTFQRSLINTLQIMLDENPNRKNDFGARAFISHEWITYVFNQLPDTIVDSSNDTTIEWFNSRQYNNIYAGASLVHTVGQGWNWIFTGKIWLTGYRAGDIILNGEIDKFIRSKNGKTSISVGGSMTTLEPYYFMAHYSSNHFIWENNFNKTKEIVAYAEIENEPYKFKLKGSISTISDFIYFDTAAVPVQHQPVLNVFAADVYKHFKLGPFHSIHHLVFQQPTNPDILRIPNLSYYTSDFFAFTLAKKVLSLEIGFDLYYYTRYRGFAYMPSSGVFYHQDVRKIGNYPYADAFLTAKLKRTRFFVKYDHVNSGLPGKNCFNVLNYPMPAGRFRWGLSWTFYD
jgi:hypothetical protein